MRRLSIRSDARLTKATLIKLGQSLDVDYLCYGSYDANLPPGDTQLKDSSIQLTAHCLNLKKMRDEPEVSEAGKLSELSRMEEHLAWQSLKYIDPSTNLPLDQFLAPQKLIRLDAEESYIRGLLSSNPDQQQKWFAQAAALDPQFLSPVFELGKLALQHNDYRQALTYFQRIAPGNPNYPEARFKMGICAFGIGDYNTAADDFREILKTYPLSEVHNNLGAAESQLGLPVAIDEFRHALDGDQSDPVYLFNLGAALLRNNYFEEAQKRLESTLARDPDDEEAQSLLERAQRREQTAPATKSLAVARLKPDFNETAFRQLKTVLQPKASK